MVGYVRIVPAVGVDCTVYRVNTVASIYGSLSLQKAWGLLEYWPGPPCVIAVNGWRHTFCSSCISWNWQNLAAEQLLLGQAVRFSASTSIQNQPLLLTTFHQSWAGARPGPILYVFSLWCRQSDINLPTLADAISTTFCYWFCNLLIFTNTFCLFVHSI